MFRLFNVSKLEYNIREWEDYKFLQLLQPNWDDGFIKIMKSTDARILEMVPSSVVKYKNVPGGQRIKPIGWNDTEMLFLDSIPSNVLDGLCFGVNQPVNLSRLSRFPNLRYLSFPSQFIELPDLTHFRKLEVLETGYKSSMKSAFECFELKHMCLTRYPFENLTPLSKMTGLNSLQISGRKIETLEGIGDLTALREIEILHATSLKHVHDLADNTNIQKVTLFRCGKVEGIERYSDIIDTCKGMN